MDSGTTKTDEGVGFLPRPKPWASSVRPCEAGRCSESDEKRRIDTPSAGGTVRPIGPPGG